MEHIKNHYIKTLMFVFTFLFIITLNAQESIEIKQEKKGEYELGTKTALEIDNSFGNVIIDTWDEDKITVLVEITVKGNSSEAIQERIETIDISFYEDEERVTIKTNISNFKSSWWKSWFQKAVTHYSINYFVKAPSVLNLNVSNKFGAVHIDDTQGKLDLEVSYGKALLGKLMNESNDIELDYSSNSSIDYLEEGIIDVKYGSLEIKKCNKLEINSDYCSLVMGDIKDLDIDAEYGGLKIDKVSNAKIDSEYFTIKIKELSNEGKINMEYGALKVEKLLSSFTKLEVKGDYTVIGIGIDEQTAFDFQVDTEYSGLKSNLPLTYSKKISNNQEKYYEGTYGNKENKGIITISSEYGAVKFNQ